MYGILALIFLVLSLLAGWAITYRLKPGLRPVELMVMSPVIGIMLATWTAFMPASIFWNIDAGIVMSFAVMVIVVAILRLPLTVTINRNELLIIAFIAALSFALMTSCVLPFYDGEYHIAFPLYGDAAYHSSIITSFSQGQNFPPEYPMMAGQPMHYTFFIDFFSGILDRLGLGLQWSMVIPGAILLSSLLSSIFFLGKRFTGRIGGGALSVILLALSGGLGFLALFDSWTQSGMSIYNFLATQNLNYTTNYQLGYVFTNFIIVVMAQRTALMGFSAGIIIILLFYAMLVDRKEEGTDNKNGLMAAGLIAGLLPMFHTHSYICIMMACTLLLIIYREKNWHYFMVPAILLALPQALWISGGVTESFLRFKLGWMIDSIWDFPVFWIKNMGFALVLLIAGIFIAGKKNLKFYLPFITIFLMANLVIFQPWEYDNHKFFSFWLMPSVLLMASALLRIYDMPKAGKPVFALVLGLTIITGAMAAMFIVSNKYVEFNEGDVYVSGWIKENTAADSLFITSDTPTHPVITLAGRPSYMGYGGWMYTHGIEYGDRMYNVAKIYNAEDENATMELLRSLDIDYVFVGPAERGSEYYTVNKGFYDRNLVEVLNWTWDRWGQDYHIYRMPDI
nr:hypothetical protein [Methanocella sp. CWC-04]